MSRASTVHRALVRTEKGTWLVLRAPGLPAGGAGARFAGGPGPWKIIVVRGRPRRVFDVPAGRALGAADDASYEAAVYRWAEATRDGVAPPGWSAPESAEVDRWLGGERGEESDDAAVVRVEGGVVRGKVVLAPGRFTLCFPLAPAAAPALDASRLPWLRLLLEDAQTRWRQVRFRGVDGEGARPGPLHAEVDLTGAPAEFQEPLFRSALGGLRWVVRWIHPSISAVLDPALRSEVLVLHDTTDEPRSTHKEKHR